MVKKRASASSEQDETNQLTSNIRRTALSLAVAAALPSAMAMPMAAYAQDEDEANDEVIEEIVTYGTFRQSLLNSLEAKRNNSSIVEAISAEDIGKLPDVSIAESLSRLPGLSVQRLNGRGQVVNLRGMSPDFSTGLLNGREQVSVGDNRGVEFDQYPSELLQQVMVYKTPDAALIGQGLSGTVDLRTVRPLEYGERAVNLNLRLEQSEYDLVSTRDDTGERYSATYIDQFADDTVGIVLGYSHATTPSYGQNNNAWGYYVDDGSGNVAIGGGRVWARASELDRDSFMGALDYQPNDQLTIRFDTFISSFTEDQIKHGFVMANLGGLTATATEQFQIGDQTANIVTAGTYSDSQLSLENNVFLRDADMQSFGFNVDYTFDNSWVAKFDVSHSSIDRSDTAEFESNSAPGGAGSLNDTVTFETGSYGTRFGVGRDYSNLDYSTADPIYATSPYGWGDGNALAPYVPAGQFGYNKVFDVEDDINAFRVELERDLEWGAITGVEFGVNLTNREKTRVSNEGVITSGIIDSGTGLLAEQVEIPSSIAGTADLSWGMLGSNTRMVAYNPYDLLAAGAIQQGAYLYDDIFAKAWVVEEDVLSTYFKFELDYMLGEMPLSGNFGLQFQDWDQSSSGQNAFGSGASLVNESFSDSESDSELLPSVNLTLEMTDNQKLRFGYARTLARPRMDEMKASGFYSFDNTAIDPGTGEFYTQADVDALIAAGVPEIQAYDTLSPWSRNGGNTKLKPWVADSFDLSYEYYLDDGYGYFAAAVFYKDLKSYIFDQTLLFDFTGLPSTSATPPNLFIGPTTSPQNGTGGSIDGYELSGSLDLGFFTPSLEGLGLVYTYSRNDSAIEPNGPGSGSRLPGLSDKVWNMTLYYERDGFSARVNQRYRDGYVGEVSGFGGARTGSDIEEETVVDAQISYMFQSGRFDGLTILLQGQNLTDEPFRTVDGGTGLPNEYQTFGATYSLGVSYGLY
ncbi:MAG: TonB-dependent receptor [Gammaproteobacteria bacterium]|nr:TonB-dependent receptor [Gammaproteobacteria bacterium]